MATKRRIFYSFHFDNDVFRVQQIRQMGVLEGDEPVTANKWEEVKKGGEAAIQRWIDENMSGKSCIVVLIGQDTASSPWVRYEIKKAWEECKGIVSIHIHNLKCPVRAKAYPYTEGKCPMGTNPLSTFTVNGKSMDQIVRTYNPSSGDAYGDIKTNLEKWIEEAINIRSNYTK